MVCCVSCVLCGVCCVVCGVCCTVCGVYGVVSRQSHSHTIVNPLCSNVMFAWSFSYVIF